jgi:hypothetical protein
MKTLQEDIDDLDRLVDGNAQKDAIRSQIRLISREVAALQTDYSSLAESHSNLKEEHSALQQGLENLKERDRRELDDWLQQQADAYTQAIKRHTLDHRA